MLLRAWPRRTTNYLSRTLVEETEIFCNNPSYTKASSLDFVILRRTTGDKMLWPSTECVQAGKDLWWHRKILALMSLISLLSCGRQSRLAYLWPYSDRNKIMVFIRRHPGGPVHASLEELLPKGRQYSLNVVYIFVGRVETAR